MKKIFIVILWLCSWSLSAQDFYDLETIQIIEIYFSQSNWDQILDAAKNSTEDYTLATSVVINGEVFDSVGVKYKGNSTYNANQTKNPFHIELDTYKEHDYQGYKDIKLSNVAKDPSFLREVLSYQILRQYMAAPLSNFANVYVNGTLMGLYSNSEAITKTFVKDRFGSKNNTFVKCNPIDGAGPGTTALPNLRYLGDNITSYDDAYELKSDEGWDELIDLCDTLANHTEAVEQILDVDKALWMLAFDNVLVNLDSYIGGFAQNYYLYRDDYGRFASIVWDLNESFGKFARTGNGNLNNTAAKQTMSHLLQIDDADYPLISQLLNVPLYRRMYLAHVKTMLLENFDNDSYFETGQQLQALIADAVQADNNKFFTYNNFLDNLTSDIGGGGGPGGPGGGQTTPGITNLMNGRVDYLLGLSDFTNVEPTITDIAASDTAPTVNSTVTMTANITDATTAYLGYRTERFAPFTRIEMFDDGSHNDSAAGDGIFGVDLFIEDFFTEYYIYAENNQMGKFSPVRAEHEFYTLTATLTNPEIGDLVINEFMASNEETVADQDGEFDDWIELYNNGNTAIDLSGYALSDDAGELTKWIFPEGINIGAGFYLIVWADSDEDQEGLHAGFKLSASAESIYLVDPSVNIIDEVTYYDQVSDVTYGRFPNGTGNFQRLEPTFNAENDVFTSTQELETVYYDFYPNPTSSELFLNFDQPENINLHFYRADGQLFKKEYFADAATDFQVDINDWPTGIYYVLIQGTDFVINEVLVVER